MLGSPLSHPRKRLRDRCAHGPAANAECLGDLLLRESEVVMRDDDRSLPLREELEQPTHFESMHDRGGRIVRGALGHARLAQGAKESASCLSQRNAIEPTLEVPIVRRRMTETFLEGVMQTVERALAIERCRDERAIHLREGAVIELLPSLDRELGHARGNAI